MLFERKSWIHLSISPRTPKCCNLLSRAKKTGRQNHTLTQWKMLHSKTVVNIISNLSSCCMTLIVILFPIFWHFVDMGIIRQGHFFNLWQSNQILKWHWRPEFLARDSKKQSSMRDPVKRLLKVQVNINWPRIV
jgi:hypothetical protein